MVYKILKNSVLDYHRENVKILKKSDEILRFANELEDDANFERISKDEICACLNDLLADLNPSYAEILQKIDFNEESIQILAKEKKLSLNNLTVKLHRARKALKQSLELTCGACTKHGCLNCTCDL